MSSEIPANAAVLDMNLSLPSFRDGIAFTVRPLNFGGVRQMLSVESLGPVSMISAMLVETVKREFPNVTEAEVDKLEQDDFVKLLERATEANKGLSEMGFTPPTSTDS